MKHELPPIRVSRKTSDRLAIYADLLRTWSPTINLISRADLSDLMHRHIDDCLQLASLVPGPDAGICVDLGSGAGLPGLVLAIACDRPFHLIESDRRKASFLREAARQCGTDVTIHPQRTDALAPLKATFISARALAPLPQLLAWAEPHLATGGTCVFPKGRQAEAELTQATVGWHMRVRRWASHTDPHATILELSEIARR